MLRWREDAEPGTMGAAAVLLTLLRLLAAALLGGAWARGSKSGAALALVALQVGRPPLCVFVLCYCETDHPVRAFVGCCIECNGRDG